ncbi:MAG: putative polymerase subfamily sigma factor [Ilumatobacteraceae bacterium]|nr:putative polymerase subfamily sigma factor [Ilumatobacteraceae bacterium]
MSTSDPSIDAANQRWATVYRDEAPRLMRLATVLIGPDGAHDLVVDAVHRVVGRADFEKIAEPGAYLARVLVNAAHSLHRADHRRRAREDRAGRLTAVGSADPASAIDVQRALQRLSPQQRAVAYFTYWEDLSIADVASRLEVTEGTVRRQLARAKDRLREVLR